MSVLVPWIGVFVVSLAASFVGAYLQRHRKKQKALLKKFQVQVQSSAQTATDPQAAVGPASGGLRPNTQAKIGPFAN